MTNHRSIAYLIACILWPAIGCGGPSIVPLEVGDLVPRFELIDVGAQRSFSSESLKGNVVILTFWSTSCPICIREIEGLKGIHAAGRAQVVGIAIDDDPEQINKVVKAKQINYPVLSGNAAMFTQYDGFSTPYTLVLDRHSVVRKKYHGPIQEGELDQFIIDI